MWKIITFPKKISKLKGQLRSSKVIKTLPIAPGRTKLPVSSRLNEDKDMKPITMCLIVNTMKTRHKMCNMTCLGDVDINLSSKLQTYIDLPNLLWPRELAINLTCFGHKILT